MVFPSFDAELKRAAVKEGACVGGEGAKTVFCTSLSVGVHIEVFVFPKRCQFSSRILSDFRFVILDRVQTTKSGFSEKFASDVAQKSASFAKPPEPPTNQEKKVQAPGCCPKVVIISEQNGELFFDVSLIRRGPGFSKIPADFWATWVLNLFHAINSIFLHHLGINNTTEIDRWNVCVESDLTQIIKFISSGPGFHMAELNSQFESHGPERP
tara:strand:- start:1199 stop:1834 length:636 start_codon:yes stop_codon:yes gene_type:complete